MHPVRCHRQLLCKKAICRLHATSILRLDVEAASIVKDGSGHEGAEDLLGIILAKEEHKHGNTTYFQASTSPLCSSQRDTQLTVSKGSVLASRKSTIELCCNAGLCDAMVRNGVDD